uniref:Uncharacterized protein n=1 Tax=Aegilops tauschii subsp. strangulata TaxID=200361 RepID=A0A453E791_AEGTS
NLRIAEKKKKCVVLGTASARAKVNPNQTIGKVLSKKAAYADDIAQTLGRIWCPREGTLCKELRRNLFLLTFGQASGKRKALEGGPWLVGKELLVLEDFVASKTLDDYEFWYFSIWVRVSNIPLGMMNKETGELIGQAMGEFMEAEIDAEDMAVGE